MKMFVDNRVAWYLPVMFSLSHGSALAFQDIYEPDDELEQAHVLIVGDNKRQQHTLHSRADEDWFKFYAKAELRYNIRANPVGADLDIALELYSSDGNPISKENEGFEGEEEILSWQAPSEGFYYVKVSDVAPSSDSCRLKIQYELHISGLAPVFDGAIKGVVTDAISGQPLANAIVYSGCQKNYPVPSFHDGSYYLTSEASVCELTAKLNGYKPLTCQVHIPKIFSIRRNMPLLPNDQTVPAPLLFKTVYHPGDTLYAEFQAIGLPPQSCIRYYFGIAYPDGRFFIITDLNRFEPFDGNYLPFWLGPQNVIMDKPIGDDMPHGEYQLYILRMPEGIDDPLNNMDKGELNRVAFRIE
jgi:hypothetical protein